MTPETKDRLVALVALVAKWTQVEDAVREDLKYTARSHDAELVQARNRGDADRARWCIADLHEVIRQLRQMDETPAPAEVSWQPSSGSLRDHADKVNAAPADAPATTAAWKCSQCGETRTGVGPFYCRRATGFNNHCTAAPLPASPVALPVERVQELIESLTENMLAILFGTGLSKKETGTR